MMRRWSFYDLGTGDFTGRQFSSPYAHDLKIPEGCGAKEGAHDPLTRRVDLKSGDVVKWSNDKLAAEQERRAAVNAAQSQIRELEEKAQRSFREDRLRPDERDKDGKLPSERLQDIDTQIAALREVLSGGKDTSEP